MPFALLVLAFFAGAYIALVIRALIGDAAARRIQRAAETLDPEHLERLRAYIGEIDDRERGRIVEMRRDGGSTVVRFP